MMENSQRAEMVKKLGPEGRRKRLAALARYVDALTRPGFEFGTEPDVTPLGEGVFAINDGRMDVEATSFMEDVYAADWIEEFDWTSWGYSEEGKIFLTNAGAIAHATDDQIARILTWFIRKDRFCSGTLLGAFKDGHLTALAQRAGALLNGADKVSRILSPDFESALSDEKGILHPVLLLARRDKDIILDIRAERIDLYCKGHIVFQVEKIGDRYLVRGPHKLFSAKPDFYAKSGELLSYIETELPVIKHLIATHSATGREVEFEQAIIRACNYENTNSDYLIVDRQVATPGRAAQIDLLGVVWQKHSNLEAFPALLETKYLTRGGVGNIADQIAGYYDHIKSDFEPFKRDLQDLLQQKARLRLFPGLSVGAQENLKNVRIIGGIEKLDIVAALVDYSPRAGNDYIDALRALPFASQITIKRLGFAMWKDNSHTLATDLAEQVTP